MIPHYDRMCDYGDVDLFVYSDGSACNRRAASVSVPVAIDNDGDGIIEKSGVRACTLASASWTMRARTMSQTLPGSVVACKLLSNRQMRFILSKRFLLDSKAQGVGLPLVLIGFSAEERESEGSPRGEGRAGQNLQSYVEHNNATTRISRVVDHENHQQNDSSSLALISTPSSATDITQYGSLTATIRMPGISAKKCWDW